MFTRIFRSFQVYLNATLCKGVAELVGKGGAVRVQQGDADLVNCSFYDNTAR